MTELKAALAIMRAEAAVWDQQSAALGAARGKVDEMELGYLEAGVFMGMVHAYNDMVHELRSRCDEGAKALPIVGQTLRQVADTYERTDEQIARQVRNIV